MTEGLSLLDLKFDYRSDEDDLVDDFFVPCLSRSVRYDRAVGYFTAEGLSLAARGIAELIKNGGHMRLIVGALLREEDRDQILRGYEARLAESLASSLENEIRNMNDETIKQRIASLAWLVSTSRLEVKVAIRIDSSGRVCRGIYHEKMGAFHDSTGNVVAFVGSSNETPGGLVGNFETNEVYADWRGGEESRVEKKVADFERMWNDETTNLRVLDFTRSVEEKLLPFKPIVPSDHDPEDRRSDTFLAQVSSKHSPMPFQLSAMQKWKESNCRGILAMATGSGKTYTAVKAIESFVHENALIIVLVPSKEIADQWQNEILRELPKSRIVHCYSTVPDWNERLSTIVDYYELTEGNEIGRTFVISIYDTACKPGFLGKVNRLPSNRMCIICDEVHNAGTAVSRRVFSIDAKSRIGLSATPERDWDEEGTQAILDYFGGVIYTFDIGMAIQQHRLTPYEYYVHPVVLEPEELANYRELSKKITRLVSALAKNHPEYAREPLQRLLPMLMNREGQAGELEVLLFRRAAILKKARSKLAKLLEITAGQRVGRCLVYCNDQEQVDEATQLLIEQGVNALQYTSRMTSAERQRARESFEQGLCDILVAIKCLDEGVDIPACDSAIIIASSKSRREFVQRRGRVLRLHPSKTKSIIHDMIVLPFADEQHSFPLEHTELYFIDSEFERAQVFAKNAMNAPQVAESINMIRHLIGKSVPLGENL